MRFLHVQDLVKEYRRGKIEIPVLKGLEFQVERGNFVAVMGASGSGKTTLMNILGFLDRPTAGTYEIEGRNVSQLSSNQRASLRNELIGFVFQNYNLLARMSALDNVLLPLLYSTGRADARTETERAIALLERVGLGHRIHHEPSEMSGGEQQRAAIARALINNPSLLLVDEPTGNLDEESSREVLQVFEELSLDEGITIVMVTHDLEVAERAHRIVQIRDGRMQNERAGNTSLQPAESSAASPLAENTRRTACASNDAYSLRFASALNPLCTIRLAVESISRNFFRSLLTTFGVVVGVAAIISVIEIGQGSTIAIKQVLTNMGAATLAITPGASFRNGVSLGRGTVKTLTPQDADAIAEECERITQAAPVVFARAQVVHGNRNWVPIWIYGTTPSFLAVRDWNDIAMGDPFTEEDVRKGNQVCLLGNTVAEELFSGRDPIGKDVRVRNVYFRVLGVLSKKGVNLIGVDQDDILLAPWTTVKHRVSGDDSDASNQSDAQKSHSPSRRRFSKVQDKLYPESTPLQKANTPQPLSFANVDFILARVRETEQIPQAREQVTRLLRARHHRRPNEENDFGVRDFVELVAALEATTRLLMNLLLVMACISFVVGGVGIMNIMLVSVTERTREIGLRLAVGATRTAILLQFLVEAATICLAGAVIGAVLGRLVTLTIEDVLDWPTTASISAALVATGLSILIGVIFGFYPAYKASRMDPIEALRYE